ncbi:Putative ABC transporter arginine-binding protein 2 [Serratia symbiotica]|nr:Putative ABC transporter arginine-binding protein 2 [Serratia symbiotica]
MKKYLIASVLAGISVSASAVETIRFATDASYPPFEFIDDNNTIQGVDIDVANTLCYEMQAKCIFTNQAFDMLIPGLKFKRFDAVIAGLDITPDRKKQVLFSNPYFSNSALFIALKNSVADASALKGKKVGVQNGTTHQKYLADKHPEITTIPYDNYQNAMLDLKNGRVDTVFGDTAVVNEWLIHNKELATVENKVTDKDYFGSGLGIALSQTNTELQSKFNAALEKCKQDGTYEILYKKWFEK